MYEQGTENPTPLEEAYEQKWFSVLKRTAHDGHIESEKYIDNNLFFQQQLNTQQSKTWILKKH